MSWTYNLITRPVLSCLKCSENPIPIAINFTNTKYDIITLVEHIIEVSYCNETNSIKLVRKNGTSEIIDIHVEKYTILKSFWITYQLYKATGHTHK